MPRNYDNPAWIPVARFMSEKLGDDEMAGKAVGCDPAEMWASAKFDTLVRWMTADDADNAAVADAVAFAAVSVNARRSDTAACLLGEAAQYLKGSRPPRLRSRIEEERQRLAKLDGSASLRMTAFAAEQVRTLGDYGPGNIDFPWYARRAADALVDIVETEMVDRLRKEFIPPWENR